MKTYIALLRGINVSGQKKVPMVELRELLINIGFKNVETYIQSGNVLFQSAEEKSNELEQRIIDSINNHFGFEVSVLVKTPNEIQGVLDNCPFSEAKKEKSYFTLLHSVPNEELINSSLKETYPYETFFIENDCVYFYPENGYGRAKCNNNFFERKLKVTATTRNYRTMLKLLAMSVKNKADV